MNNFGYQSTQYPFDSDGVGLSPSLAPGLNPSSMVPGGGAFTLRQWGQLYQSRSDALNNRDLYGGDGDSESSTPSTNADTAQTESSSVADTSNSTASPVPSSDAKTQVSQWFGPLISEPPIVPPRAPIEPIVPKVGPRLPVPSPDVTDPIPSLKSPFEKFPADRTQSPGEDYEWKGRGGPETGKGQWVNPKTGEKVFNDMDHPPPEGPHIDYWGPPNSKEYPNKDGYRIFPNGRIVPKEIILPEDWT